MSNEELVERIQKGEKELMPVLWEQVRRFCWKIVYRYPTTACVSHEDLIQEAYLALVAAVNSYRFGKGMSFIGWLLGYVRNQCRRVVNNDEDSYRTLSFSAQVPEAEDLTLEDMLEDPTVDLDARLYWEDALHLLDVLPERKRKLLQAYAVEGRSTKDIAAERGISPTAVNTYIREARMMLRSRLREQWRLHRLREELAWHGKGVAAFNTSWSSTVEDAVIYLDEASSSQMNTRRY